MTYGRSLFDQPIYNNKKTSENIRKIATCQKDNYTADSLL